MRLNSKSLIIFFIETIDPFSCWESLDRAYPTSKSGYSEKENGCWTPVRAAKEISLFLLLHVVASVLRELINDHFTLSELKC